MKAPLFVRELTAAERRQLEVGLRSHDAFTVRRCQILLASADGKRPSQIAAPLGCTAGTVRNAIGAFAIEGPACLRRKPSRAKTRQPVLTSTDGERLKALLHQSPRHFGKPQSTWSLKLLAEVACEQKLTPRVLSHEAMRQAVRRLKVGWKRAKRWITSPDPAYARKKSLGIG